MAGDGIGIFYLYYIVMRIGFHLLHFSGLGGDIVIIDVYKRQT